MVLGRAAIRDMYPAREAASKMGYVNMIMALAPMLGPLLGGVIDEMFGWRATFLFFVVSGAGLFWLTYADLGETNHDRSDTFLEQFRAYPELLTSRRFWGYSFVLTFSIGVFYLFIAGIPLVGVRRFNLSPSEVGFGVGIISAGFMAGNFVSGPGGNTLCADHDDHLWQVGGHDRGRHRPDPVPFGGWAIMPSCSARVFPPGSAMA